MPFNFSNYILNEALTSNILRDIMQEPTGFFKYMQPPVTKVVKSIQNQQTLSTSTVDNRIAIMAGQLSTFMEKGMKSTLYHARLDDGFSEENPMEIQQTDKFFSYTLTDQKKIHAKYMELFNKAKSMVKNIAKRPKGTILRTLLSGGRDIESAYIDLANITNSYFKRYTVKELATRMGKGSLAEGFRYLYFNKNGEFLCASTSDSIYAVNPLAGITWPGDKADLVDNRADNHGNIGLIRAIGDQNKEQIKDEDAFSTLSLFTKLEDGSVVEWPLVYSSNPRDRYTWRDARPGQYSGSLTKMKWYWDKYSKAYMPGKPWSKSSNINKISKWAEDPENYVIAFNFNKYMIYRPKEEYEGKADDNANVRVDIRRKKRNQREEAYDYSADQTRYKWRYDTMLKLVPYYIIYENNIFKEQETDDYMYVVSFDEKEGKYVGARLHQYETEKHNIVWCSNPDRYAMLCRKRNFARYKEMYALRKVNKESKTLIKTQKDIEQRLADAMQQSNNVLAGIKAIISDKLTPAADKRCWMSILTGRSFNGIDYSENRPLSEMMSRATGCVIESTKRCDQFIATIQEIEKNPQSVNPGQLMALQNEFKDMLETTSNGLNMTFETISKIQEMVNQYKAGTFKFDKMNDTNP